MKNVTFYFLKKNITQDGLSSIEQLTCDITAEFWRSGKSIFIICENKQQAILINNALWIRPPKSFIPHGLTGEKFINQSPIEISWIKKYNFNTRNILINLCFNFMSFFNLFKEVIDFIPYEESLKQLARKRYKAFRMAGFNIKIQQYINNEKNI